MINEEDSAAEATIMINTLSKNLRNSNIENPETTLKSQKIESMQRKVNSTQDQSIYLKN